MAARRWGTAGSGCTSRVLREFASATLRPGARNVIAGNQQGGIRVGGSASVQTQINNNKIGRDKNNTPLAQAIDLGNKRYAVLVEDLARNTQIKRNNEIMFAKAFGGAAGGGITTRTGATGTEKFDPNVIAFNDGLGIDLGDDGVTLNDYQDPDSGPDDLQNFPVLTSAVVYSDVIVIQGTLNSTPSSYGPPRLFQIELFGNAACDPSGYGEGEQFIGGAQVATNQSGNASFQVTLGFTAGSYTVVTATATDLMTRNTSEFSACLGVTITEGMQTPRSPSPSASATGGDLRDLNLESGSSPESATHGWASLPAHAGLRQKETVPESMSGMFEPAIAPVQPDRRKLAAVDWHFSHLEDVGPLNLGFVDDWDAL